MVSACTGGAQRFMVRYHHALLTIEKEKSYINAISITIRRFGQTPVASQQQRSIQAVSVPSGEGGRNHGVYGATSSPSGCGSTTD